MGSASKVASVCLRIGELICATIVVGILGHYLYLLDQADANVNSRITYTIAIAGTSLGLSILLMPPFMYSFWAFPVDYALFICWMVAFGLMVDVRSSAAAVFTKYDPGLSYTNKIIAYWLKRMQLNLVLE